jgi:hypothetical protein
MESVMSRYTQRELLNRAAKLADLIVRAQPAQIWFRSEEQFLEMLGLPQMQLQNHVPVSVGQSE